MIGSHKINSQGICALRRTLHWSCQPISQDIHPGTGNLQSDPMSFHLELASAPERAARSDIWGSQAGSGSVEREMAGKTVGGHMMGRWVNVIFCRIWPCWPGTSHVINATQLLLIGYRSPVPLTLCTSKRSSVAGHMHRSAPGCAGLQVGAQSYISFLQQSAPGARHCSSRRD